MLRRIWPTAYAVDTSTTHDAIVLSVNEIEGGGVALMLSPLQAMMIAHGLLAAMHVVVVETGEDEQAAMPFITEATP